MILYQHYYTYQDQVSVAGCYYITSVDSVPYSNESVPSDTICFDNCPLLNYLIYLLRTVMEIMIHSKIRHDQVREWDRLTSFNRWGDPVFKTITPLFTWEGIHQESQLPLPSGIYYYTCIVETLRLQGIVYKILMALPFSKRF